MAIHHHITDLIGRTPMLQLHRLAARAGAKGEILAKLECFNPGGSIKDRAAKAMLDDAESRGVLTAGATVIEPTSGNTGIGLAAICAARGYKAIIVMPDSMSAERINLMKAYGAQVVLTPGAKGMAGAIEKANALAAEIPGSFIAGQFENPANAQAHYDTTGPEIWADTDGNVDILVCGVGTGGTITGTGRYLKAQNPDIRIVAVEPATSAVLSGQEAGTHGLQGIGAGFIPKVLDTSILDEIMPVEDCDAFAAAKEFAANQGILVGISSGAALHAALLLAMKEENRGKTIVTILPDSGERYLSTGLFN